jgi:hypothetical protein
MVLSDAYLERAVAKQQGDSRQIFWILWWVEVIRLLIDSGGKMVRSRMSSGPCLVCVQPRVHHSVTKVGGACSVGTSVDQSPTALEKSEQHLTLEEAVPQAVMQDCSRCISLSYLPDARRATVGVQLVQSAGVVATLPRDDESFTAVACCGRRLWTARLLLVLCDQTGPRSNPEDVAALVLLDWPVQIPSQK